MKASASILVVDDEKDFASGMVRILQSRFQKHRCLDCTSGEQALRLMKTNSIGVMLTDLRMPGLGGMALLEKALEIHPQLCVVLMTAYGSIEDAVKSLKRGAYDFITKPVNRDTLFRVTEKAMERHQLMSENQRLRKLTERCDLQQTMIGESAAMKRFSESVAAVAATDYTVLIFGESGTGKELAARSIHNLSIRCRKPLLSINCPAIPEQLLESELFGHVRGAFTGAERNRKGLFEAADGGTLLLDEIGDISPAIQAKLLRVLQEKEIRPVGSSEKKRVDVRIIAITNQDLGGKIGDGSFRQDLFYRLNVLTLTVPPLRERRQDIPLLIHNFIDLTCREMDLARLEISADAIAYLSAKTWPGNVRELLNFIRRLVVFSTGRPIRLPLIKAVEKYGDGNISQEFPIIPYKEAKARITDEFTIGYVNSLLHTTGGNISAAARISGLERASLQKIIRRLHIDTNIHRK